MSRLLALSRLDSVDYYGGGGGLVGMRIFVSERQNYLKTVGVEEASAWLGFVAHVGPSPRDGGLREGNMDSRLRRGFNFDVGRRVFHEQPIALVRTEEIGMASIPDTRRCT